jgi:hypothetical protein
MNYPITLSEATLGKIISGLELAPIVQIEPIAVKVVSIPEEFIQKLYISDSSAKVAYFNVWKIATATNNYFLVGTNNIFFAEKQLNNPFEESDNFYTFAEEIKMELGIDQAQPYVSEHGFFLFSTKVDSEEMSFFVYKI